MSVAAPELGFKPTGQGRYLTREEYKARRDSCTGEELAKLHRSRELQRLIVEGREGDPSSSLYINTRFIFSAWAGTFLLLVYFATWDAFSGHQMLFRSNPGAPLSDASTSSRRLSLEALQRPQTCPIDQDRLEHLEAEEDGNSKLFTLDELDRPSLPLSGLKESDSHTEIPAEALPCFRSFIQSFGLSNLFRGERPSWLQSQLLPVLACLAAAVGSVRVLSHRRRQLECRPASRVQKPGSLELLVPAPAESPGGAPSPITQQLLDNREQFRIMHAKLQRIRARLGPTVTCELSLATSPSKWA